MVPRSPAGYHFFKLIDMYIVLADRSDHAALWLCPKLQPYLPHPVVHITPAQLVYSTAISHRLESDRVHSQFLLADGSTLDFDNVHGVINRFGEMPTAHLARAEKAERDYAATELHAFLLGWLASIECPVLNPSSPEWLGGSWHSPMAAAEIAAQVGLACFPDPLSSDAPPPPENLTIPTDPHFVCNGRLLGPVVDSRLRDALIGFAHAWGAPLVQIEMQKRPEGPAFARASSFVDFPRGGTALTRAIAQALAA